MTCLNSNLFKFLITVWFLSFISLFSFAYIPPLKMILSRTAENSGNGIYSNELEIIFSDGSHEASTKELWTIENDRTLKVHVIGLKDLKGLNLNYLYLSGQRWARKNNNKESIKISDDFIEKWHHFRNSDLLYKSLLAHGFLNDEDSNLKLSRIQGVVAYSISDHKNNDPLAPRFWIEQDFFLIRKLRLSSGAEVSMDNYKSYSKGLHYPKERTLKWGNNSILIKTVTVNARPGGQGNLFSPQSLETNNQSDVLLNHPLKSQIEEFYTRFR